CDVPSIGIGSQLIDFGHYTFTPQEKADFLEKEPQAEKYFYRLSGGREFLNGIERWVLWLGEITLQDLQQMPMVRERIEAVRDRKSTRLNSSHVSISYAVFCLKKKIKYI